MATDPGRLHACHALGLQAWPQVKLALDRFQAHIDGLALEEGTWEANAGDLYLAVAALHGDVPALKELDAAYVRPACTIVGRLDSSAGFRDEMEQRLRVRLLAGPEPRLRLYRGASGLLEWMRVVAWRLALNAKRSDNRLVPTEDLPIASLVGGEAERDAIKGLDLESFRRAIADSFERLPPRERTLLRLHFVNGLNIEAIGVAYGVHRATVARWLVTIRRSLFESVRELLASVRTLDSRTMRSLYRLLEPELQITLSDLLAGETPAEAGSRTAGTRT